MVLPPLVVALFAQAATDPAGAFLQYGAVGGVAVVALGCVGVLFRLLLTAYQRERDRADRLEEEVRSLEKDAREKVVPALTRSTEAVADAMQVLSTMKFRR